MRAPTVGILYGHPLDVGGVETHLLTLFGKSDPTRFRWRVIARASEAFAEAACRAGAEIVPWSARHAADLRSVVELRRILRAHPVDLLHVHHPRALLPARLAAPRVPLVYTVHLPIQERVRAWLEARVIAIARPSRIIHVSKRSFLAGASGSRQALIRNGVSLHEETDRVLAQHLRAALGDANAVVVLAVARLVPQKGLDVLLDAFRRVPLAAKLWIVGDGPERQALEALARDHGLGPRVTFLGTRPDVPALLNACDIFVLPSRHETTPLALLEAMAASRACVATDVGDCADVLGDAGRIVPSGDPDRLAAEISNLVVDSQRRLTLGGTARARAVQFADVVMTQQTGDLLSSLLLHPIRQDNAERSVQT